MMYQWVYFWRKVDSDRNLKGEGRDMLIYRSHLKFGIRQASLTTLQFFLYWQHWNVLFSTIAIVGNPSVVGVGIGSICPLYRKSVNVD